MESSRATALLHVLQEHPMHVKRKSSDAQVNKKWGLFGPTSTFMVAIRERRVLVGIILTKTVSRGSRYQAKSQFELQLFVNVH